MNGRRFVAAAAVLAVVTAVAGAGAVGAGPASTVLGEVLGDEEQHPPALLSFESAGAQCTDDFVANSSTSVRAGGPTTEITHARNVSLPGPSHAIGGPTFERYNETTYVLSIPVEETEKAPRDCAGVARYEAAMRIPAGDDPWRVVVEHDGETVTTLWGDADSSGAGSSVSAGGSASA